MKREKIKLFREEDYKSRLLNIDKYEWISGILEKKYNKKLSDSHIVDILNNFIKIIDDFYNSEIGIHNINEADTVDYFIEPFLSSIMPSMYKTSEFRLPEQNIRLDSVIYDSSKYSNGEITDSDSNFIFIEYKKASIFSNSRSDDVYSVAAEHNLLQKQSKNSCTDKLVLKGVQSRQMVQYLDATKSIGNTNCKDGMNTSAGIITNGLNYYFMICNGNDSEASNQTWSILYKLDIAELAHDMDIKDASVKIGTFLGLIDVFMSNKKRADFFKYYHNQYRAVSSTIATLDSNKESYENYAKSILKNKNSMSNILTTYNNYKRIIGA